MTESDPATTLPLRSQQHAKFRQLLEGDEFDRKLLDQVHPTAWINPEPKGRYNLVVIGAGTAGLVTAAGAAGLGARVALIERDMMGGDCLNVGCVPSKAVLSAARVAASLERASEFGVHLHEKPQVNFAQVMQRMRQLRSEISHNDSADRFRKLGVDVFFGEARFIDSQSITVNDATLLFQKAVIATGSKPSIPKIPGLDEVEYLTNETLFSLTSLPKRLAVIGAGPIGCEMSQAFAQLGSEVLLIESSQSVLPRDDPQAAEIVARALRRDGVRILCCGREMSIREPDSPRLVFHSNELSRDEVVDQVLVATGRTPNLKSLNLESVGVEYDPDGVQVNDYLQTTNSRIYAAGDVCSRYRFTHAADFMARIVIQNALFKGRRRFSQLVIPWATYTLPEVAHVGLCQETAAEQGIAIDTFTQELRDVDRAILEGDDEGFVRIHTRRKTDRIVGATVVARNAGDLISEITLAMTHRLGLSKIANTIHPYPTQAEAIRKIGDQYNRTRLTPLAKSLSSRWLTWSRR